jgi:Protein of unknown function (DUF3102)
MRKAKKTKAPRRKTTALDRITARLRTALRHKTENTILIGNILIEAREELQHGDWQSYLSENFDLSYRTAVRYVDAAEYVTRKSKSDTVADFANLAPTVLYRLAAGHPVQRAGRGRDPGRDPGETHRRRCRDGYLRRARTAAG